MPFIVRGGQVQTAGRKFQQSELVNGRASECTLYKLRIQATALCRPFVYYLSNVSEGYLHILTPIIKRVQIDSLIAPRARAPCNYFQFASASHYIFSLIEPLNWTWLCTPTAQLDSICK